MLLGNPFTADPRVYREAISLLKAGHEVTVIARDIGGRNPPRQTWDGIEIRRVGSRLAPRPGLAWWWWNRLNSLIWQRQALHQALALNREDPIDVVHCHDFDTLAIGTRLKRKLNAPLVYDAHEIWGYMASRSLPRWMVKRIFRLEKRLVRRVDRIINVCEPQKRYFETITDKPVTIIMNCKPLQSTEYRPPENEEFTVLYIGGLTKVRAVAMLVRTARDLPGIRCLIGGVGQPAYVQALRAECSATSNVTFLGRVPFEGVLPMTIKADAVFCMFDPGDPNNRIGMPNKLFEAMVCGRPIICTKGTYSGEVTEQEEVGLAVGYDEQALREAIIKLRDDLALREQLGQNALRAAITIYNWEKEEEKLLALYDSLRVA